MSVNTIFLAAKSLCTKPFDSKYAMPFEICEYISVLNYNKILNNVTKKKLSKTSEKSNKPII